MAEPPSDPAGKYRAESQRIGTVAVVVFGVVTIIAVVIGLPVPVAGIIGAIVAAVVVKKVAAKELS